MVAGGLEIPGPVKFMGIVSLKAAGTPDKEWEVLRKYGSSCGGMDCEGCFLLLSNSDVELANAS